MGSCIIRLMCLGLAASSLLGTATAASAATNQIDSSGAPSRLADDKKAVLAYRAGLAQVIRFGGSRPDLFPAQPLSELRMLNRENKEEVWSAWKTLLDYSMALDSIRQSYDKCLLNTDRQQRADSFLIAYQAFLAQYRFALEFIGMAEKDPGMDVLLNDAVPELGLEKGTYTRFKFTFLNAARATEFLAHKTVWTTTLSKPSIEGTGIDEDSARIAKLGRKEGQALTAENAIDLIRKGGATAWFPVQKGVSIWMGETKVRRKAACLITPEQIDEAAKHLQPGDVLLERREWYLSNVGLPGFWPHALLFIGTPETRQPLAIDPEVIAWAKSKGQPEGDFEKLLATRYPDAYAASLATQEDGHRPRILEAIGKGVIFTTLEHSAAADSLCALRPRLSPKQRAIALWRAFQYVGRPYDYDFDFMTDSAIVCTELVYKSYQDCPESTGLKFPLINILGRLAIPANELVKQFDADYNTPKQQYDLVLFLDGIEKDGKAVTGTLDEFRKSWRRPKWHVVTQKSPEEQ